MSGELSAEIVVPAREARFVNLAAGQIVEIVDVEGAQVGDMVAYVAGDPDEYLSPAHTCSCLVKLVPAVGDAFFSNRRRPLLRILRDDVGKHDLVVPCCDPERYANDLGAPDHGSCLDSLQKAARAFGVPCEIHGELAVNVFMNNVLDEHGVIQTLRPEHGAGATLAMEVLEDLVLGLSACPQDLTPCNDFNPTPMAIRVSGGPA